ncbi:MAG: P-II family nitrogen regulator [Cellvibrionaceae bacterium]|nr:P-II family nitrogen regulator [Cellvibrionaceae bacterium]
MRFKLIIVFTEESRREIIVNAARAAGATVVNSARNIEPGQKRSFFGSALEAQRDVLLFLVEQALSRQTLEYIAEVGEFESSPGTGIALQVDVEDAIGAAWQLKTQID